MQKTIAFSNYKVGSYFLPKCKIDKKDFQRQGPKSFLNYNFATVMIAFIAFLKKKMQIVKLYLKG